MSKARQIETTALVWPFATRTHCPTYNHLRIQISLLTPHLKAFLCLSLAGLKLPTFPEYPDAAKHNKGGKSLPDFKIIPVWWYIVIYVVPDTKLNSLCQYSPHLHYTKKNQLMHKNFEVSCIQGASHFLRRVICYTFVSRNKAKLAYYRKIFNYK